MGPSDCKKGQMSRKQFANRVVSLRFLTQPSHRVSRQLVLLCVIYLQLLSRRTLVAFIRLAAS